MRLDSRHSVTDRPDDAVHDKSSIASNDGQALVSAMERGRYSSLLAQISRSKMRKVEVPASPNSMQLALREAG